MSDAGAVPVKKREIFGWAMYDFANSSYTTVVISFVYSAFFATQIVPAGSEVRDSYWSIAIALSTVIAIILSPVVGALCDYSGGKKKYLFIATLTCSLSTAALALVGPGDVWLAIALIAISNAAFMVGESFVASFLTDLATSENMGIISGLGWGLGYMGGLASLILTFQYLGPLTEITQDVVVSRHQIAMVLIGGFYFLTAMPTFLMVRDRSKPKPGFENASFKRLVKVGVDELKASAQLIKQYNVLFKFFLAFMVYMAGLEVVMKFIGIYIDAELQLDASYKQILFIILQFSAAGGALGFGYLETKLGAKTTVLSTIVWWICGVLAIFFLDSIASLVGQPREVVFMGIGIIAGAGLGSIQSSSRTVVGLLAPAGRSAQVFGFWGMFMRMAIILSISFGFLSDAIGSRRYALLLVVGFFAIGGIMLSRVPITEAIKANRELQRPKDEEAAV